MATVGYLDTVLRLLGGQEVLAEARKLRQELEGFSNKPIQLKFDTSGIAKAQQDIASAQAKLNSTDKESVKTADWRLKTEREQLQLLERAQKAEEKRAQTLAKAAEARMREGVAAEQSQRKMVGLQMQAQKEYDAAVNKQAFAFQRAIQQVEKEQGARQKSVEQQALGFQRAIADVEKYQKAVQLAKNESVNALLNGVSGGLTRVGGLWDNAIRGVANFSDGLTHAGQVAATFAYRLTIITAPFDILLAKSFQFTTQLEMSLAKVGTQLDGTADKMRSFMSDAKAQILDLQGKYGVSANQQSDALYYLISSGVSQQQAQASLDPISKLAAVSQTQAGTIAQGLTAALNVFGKELERFPSLAERTSYALGVMFEATKKGRFEFGDFATQFGRAAEQVKMGGGSFEDAAAMLAALSQVFTPSQATTALNSFVKAVVDPTKEATAALKELDVELYQGGRRRSLPDVFDELFGKIGVTAQGDQEKADKAINAIFGDLRGGRAAQFFLDPKNQSLYKNIKDGLGGGQDSIAEGWKITSEQIQTNIDQVIGKFYQLGDVSLGYLRPAIKGGLEGLKIFFDTLAQNPQVVGTITQVATALAVLAPTMLVLGTALMGVGGIVTAIATLMSPAYLIGFGLAWESLAPSISKAGTAVEFFGGGITGILATVTEFARQLGLIKDTDAAKIFESLGVEQNFGGIESVTELIGGLKELAPDVTMLRDGIMGIAQGIGMLIDNISNGKGILGGFASVIKDVAGGLGILGGAGASGLASTLDLVIGGSLIAKIGGALVGALAKIVVGVQNVTAGQVNLLGFGGSGGIQGALPSAVSGGLGGLGSSLYDKNPALAAGGLVGFAAIAATLRQQFMEEVQSSLSPITKGVFIGEDVANPLFGAVSQIAKMLGFDLVKSFDDVLAKVNVGEIIAGIFKSQVPKTATPQDIHNFANNPSGLATPDDLRNFAGLPQTKAADAAISGGITMVRNFIDNTGSALDELAARAYGAAAALAGIDGGVPTGYGAPPEAGAGYGEYARSAGINAFYQKLYPDIVKFAGDKSNEYIAGVKSATDATKKFADAARNAAKQLMDTIKGLVRDALQTSVTEDQVKRSDLEVKLAKLQAQLDSTEGKPNQRRQLQSAIDDTKNQLGQLPAYQDSPDEFRRRVEAVATGTDPATYGEEFQKQLALAQSQMPGASLGDIAKSFGDFSLFANMSDEQIDQMWNFEAVADGVKRGIDKIVGEFKVMGVAVKKVLDEMPKDQMDALKQALGLGADTSLADVETGVMGALGMGTGGAAGAIGSIGASIGDDDVTKITTIAGAMKALDSVKDMIIKIVVDSAAWEAAKAAIDEAEAYIKEHLLAYADIFISITGKFSEEGSGGTGDTAAGDKPPQKARGGYVGSGVYELGEEGYEYVLPHGMVKWMEKILGGKISSPESIQWLISALARGKEETMAQLALWAGGQTGVYTPLPKNSDEWLSKLKVKGMDGKKVGYDEFMWKKGTPATKSSGGGGGGGGNAGGGGGSLDLSGLVSAITRLTIAIDRLAGALNGNLNLQLGGNGNGFNVGTANFYTPNNATFAGLSSQARELAAMGYD